MKKIIQCILALAIILTLLPAAPIARASESGQAQRLEVSITGSGYSSFGFLSDGNIGSYKNASSATLTVSAQEGMASLYIMFDKEHGAYTITDDATGKAITAGEYEFLHEYIDLKEGFGYLPTSVTIQLENAVELSELYAFTEGTLPDYVQVWEKPLDGKADLLLLATHGDDDQLYFAGLFPLYAAERGYAVQVAYMTDHRNLTDVRTHEMLNGLWATGVTAYPVFGRFADFRIDSLQGTYNEFQARGTSKDELMRFVVTQLRRFDPQVVVGHDFKGEYGHGMHQVYTDLLVEALDYTADASVYPEIAEQYGLWDVPKTYIHLYETNPIVIDYDQPLEAFDGMTAFEVTQKLGFPCHVSQQGFMFTPWLYGKSREITKVTQIATYNPAKFGLYRSTVGEDVLKNDFMENIVSYAEQERLEAERLEAERLEAERLEAERLENERLEAERLAQEELERQQEQERLEAERKEAQQQSAANAKDTILKIAIWSVVGVLAVLVAILILRLLSKPKHRGRYTRK